MGADAAAAIGPGDAAISHASEDETSGDLAPRPTDAGADRASDGSAFDGPVAGGPSRCPDIAGARCLDFDHGTPAGWSLSGGAKIDGTRPFRGTGALHLSLSGKRDMVIAANLNLGPKIWGRLFLYTTAAPVAHGSYVRASGSDGGGAYAFWAMGVQVSRFMSVYLRPTPFQELVTECNPQYANGRCPTGETLVPLRRWTCVEWAMDGTTGQSTEIHEDGRKLPLISYSGRWPTMRAFNRVEIGLMMYHDTPATELWIDEVVLADRRIGCAP